MHEMQQAGPAAQELPAAKLDTDTDGIGPDGPRDHPWTTQGNFFHEEPRFLNENDVYHTLAQMETA